MLTEPQRKYLRRLGHDREPIVLIGQKGLTDNVVAELDRALQGSRAREGSGARGGPRRARPDPCRAGGGTSAELVQRIGHVALYYRRNPDLPGILLPGAQT